MDEVNTDDEFSMEMVQAIIAEARETIRSVRDSFRRRQSSPSDCPPEDVVELEDTQPPELPPTEEQLPVDELSSTESNDAPSGSDNPGGLVSSNDQSTAATVGTVMNLSNQTDDEVVLISETLNPNPLVIDLCSPSFMTPNPCNNRPSVQSRKRQRNPPIAFNDFEVVADAEEPPPAKVTSPPRAAIPPCVICLEDLLNRRPHSTLCGHVFCFECIKQAIQSKKQCPVCRKGITMKSIHPLYMFN